MNIKTGFVQPPIPIRCFDWVAFDADTLDEGSPVGRGATEQEAIQDLMEILEEK